MLSLVIDKMEIIYASTTGAGIGYGCLYQISKNIDSSFKILSLEIDDENNIYAGVIDGKIYKIIKIITNRLVN